MKYIKEIMIILGITLIGEWLNYQLPLPVPSGVYGLFLLLVLLCTRVIKLKDIEATGNFLLDIMPLLFIPSCTGLLDSYPEMKAVMIPIAVISIVSTVVVMAVTGKITELVLMKSKKHGGKTS